MEKSGSAPQKCNYMKRARSWQEREVGCPLDHCSCGTHDSENKEHECSDPEDFFEDPMGTLEE